MIVYALIARERSVLAEFTSAVGNFTTVTRVLLGRIPSSPGIDETMSYQYDQYMFHYIVEDQITYLCMCDEDASKRMPFAFLQDIKAMALARYGLDALSKAIAFSLNAALAPVLEARMAYFNSDPGADRLRGLRGALDGVRDGVVASVERVLERGERIELLVDKSAGLSQQAFRFERTSRALRRDMVLRRLRVWVAAGAALALAGVVIAAVVCGGLGFRSCRAHS
eukprot:TRINITY_DN1649_c0_g1_i2.p1 TRINITY_DN1649_c0_g1~~TRINITY_DN1649_c0_g1_i2.p1  ORF type:complete len:225 (+),score=73.79 TRINITY_DN1649_c0_g1_i2:1657-2331(+)